jgi:hypothetical protein
VIGAANGQPFDRQKGNKDEYNDDYNMSRGYPSSRLPFAIHQPFSIN